MRSSPWEMHQSYGAFLLVYPPLSWKFEGKWPGAQPTIHDTLHAYRLNVDYNNNIGFQSDNGVLLSPGQHGDVIAQHGSR